VIGHFNKHWIKFLLVPLMDKLLGWINGFNWWPMATCHKLGRLQQIGFIILENLDKIVL
jgi:hypothetical protein